MSQEQARSGGYRNDDMRNERDPTLDEPAKGAEAAGRGDHATSPPDHRFGQNEMSKAWARESYRADYERISRETRNDFGTKRVEESEETQKQ